MIIFSVPIRIVLDSVGLSSFRFPSLERTIFFGLLAFVLSLDTTFSVIFLVIPAVLTQISTAIKVIVNLSERRDKRLGRDVVEVFPFSCEYIYIIFVLILIILKIV